MLSQPPSPPRIDPRVKRTRRLIQEAFQQLLAEKGFRAITVQDITERAEINRATFYAHYSDKYALLEESIRLAFRNELEKRTLNACHYSEENLFALIVTVCEFVAYLRDHCKSVEHHFDSLVETQVLKQLQELLKHWTEQVNRPVDRQLQAIAAAFALYGLADYWSRHKRTLQVSVEHFAQRVMPIITANLQLNA